MYPYGLAMGHRRAREWDFQAEPSRRALMQLGAVGATAAVLTSMQRPSVAQALPEHLVDTALTIAHPDLFPGLDPTGTNECAASMQAALDAVAPGGTLYIPPGRYRMGASLEVPANITISAPHRQATLVRDGHTGIQLRAYGSHGPLVALTAVPARAQLAVGGQTVEVTRITLATAQPWVPGDLVKLVADDEIPGGRRRPGASAFPRIGEYLRVHSVSGATVDLSGHTFEDYRTNVRAARLDDKTVTIVGLSLDVSDASFAASARPECELRCDSLRAPRLIGVRIHRSVGIAIQMRSCVGYHVEDAEIGHATDDAGQSIFGYGVHDVGSTGGLVFGGVARFVRHGYADKSMEPTANSEYASFYGRTFFPKIMAFEVVHPTSSAFDTHHESYGVHFDSCVARVAGVNGFGLRGSGHIVSNCAVYGGAVGVKVFTESSGGLGTGESRDIHIANLRTDGTDVVVQASIRESAHERQGIQDTERTLTLDGVVARGATRFATLTNARARLANFEVTARDLPQFVFIQNSNSRLEIDGGVLDFEAVTQTENNRNRVLRSTSSAADASSLIVIRGLRVKASPYYASQCRVGPFETDAGTDIDARVELEQTFPVMPGSLADTRRCTFGWTTMVANDDPASLSSSGLVVYSNSALTGSLVATTRAPDDALLLLASITDGTSRTLSMLGKARKTGQRLTILVATASGGAKLTVRSSASTAGVVLNGVSSIELGVGEQLQLMWTGTAWRQVS